jgi:hypothetical protein
MLPPDLCYILLFHLAYCVLLCPHRFISLGVPANFLLVFKQQQGHELCSSCTIWPTNACKSTTLGMCVLNFSERTASCYSNILCPHALSSNLRLETFKNPTLQLPRPRSTLALPTLATYISTRQWMVPASNCYALVFYLDL